MRLWRTWDWRRPPGPPRFALTELSNLRLALQSASSIHDLSHDQFLTGIFELANGQPSKIAWKPPIEEPMPEGDDIEFQLEAIELLGDDSIMTIDAANGDDSLIKASDE